MNRENVNRIKFVLDNIVPPIIRDSFLYDALLKIYFKRSFRYIFNFRPRVKNLSSMEFVEHYKQTPDIMGESDLNFLCLKNILDNSNAKTILDVGSGRGFLCKKIKEKYPKSFVSGIDIVMSNELKKVKEIKFLEGDIANLPFENNSFEVVICSHVLEHVIDFNASINELRRVCRKRLIFVVPMEREYRNGFNLHVQFFPYLHSFTNRLGWDTSMSKCSNLGGDIYFQQDINCIPES